MSTKGTGRGRGRGGRAALGLALIGTAALGAMDATAAAGAKTGRAWKTAARKLRSAELLEAKADWNLALARAQGIPVEGERDEHLEDAREEYAEARELAGERYDARLDLAAELGEEDLYAATVDAGDFVGVVDNPLFPLVPGAYRVFEAETGEGTEVIRIDVLDETVEILGVACRVVKDTVTVDGVVVEDTRDYFAQDVAGNVWYFGEIALNYEDGRLADVEGSWTAGVDGARPGIVMPAAPVVGSAYRQEFLLGEAEDFARVLSLSETVTVPAGTFAGCLRTFDGTPLEPDAAEHKYYAPGIGVVLEVDTETGERTELVEYGTVE